MGAKEVSTSTPHTRRTDKSAETKFKGASQKHCKRPQSGFGFALQFAPRLAGRALRFQRLSHFLELDSLVCVKSHLCV